MDQEKRQIFVYNKDPKSLGFLRDFFDDNDSYEARYFTNVGELRKSTRHTPPYALLAGAPKCLDRINMDGDAPPIIAMVSSDLSDGMRSVVENNLDYYVLSPYVKEDLAHKLNLICKNNECFESLYREKEDLEAVVDLSYKLTSTLDPEEVLFLTVRRIGEIIPVSRCSILSVNFDNDKTAKVVSTFESHSIKHLSLDIKNYPEIEQALKTKESVVIKDAMTDPLMESVRKTIEPIGIKSIAVIPILFRSEVIGTLFLRTTINEHNFTEREIKLCQRIAEASALSLNNAFLFEKIQSERAELKKLAITDFLTGMYNVRYFYHRLKDEFSRSQRYDVPLSCLMFDIDHFKRINDNYGHRAGDMVLREFATVLNKFVRKSDVLARYGGEEFIILLPHTTPEGAFAEAGRLADLIRKHKFKGLKADERITISTGIATYPDDRIDSKDSLISYADDALLKAKNSGRNRIEVA